MGLVVTRSEKSVMRAFVFLVLAFVVVVFAGGACNAPFFCMPYGSASCPGEPGNSLGTGGAPPPSCAAVVRIPGEGFVFVCNVLPKYANPLNPPYPAYPCGLVTCAVDLDQAEDQMTKAMRAMGDQVDPAGPPLACKAFKTYNDATDNFKLSECVKAMEAPCAMAGEECAAYGQPGPRCCPEFVCSAGTTDLTGVCCLTEEDACDPSDDKCCPANGDGPGEMCGPSNASPSPVCCLLEGAICGDELFHDSSNCCYGLYCGDTPGEDTYGHCQ